METGNEEDDNSNHIGKWIGAFLTGNRIFTGKVDRIQDKQYVLKPLHTSRCKDGKVEYGLINTEAYVPIKDTVVVYTTAENIREVIKVQNAQEDIEVMEREVKKGHLEKELRHLQKGEGEQAGFKPDR